MMRMVVIFYIVAPPSTHCVTTLTVFIVETHALIHDAHSAELFINRHAAAILPARMQTIIMEESGKIQLYKQHKLAPVGVSHATFFLELCCAVSSIVHLIVLLVCVLV